MIKLIMNTPNIAAMDSQEIADLVGKRHDNVKRTIEALVGRGVITSPQIEEKPTAGRPTTAFVFEGEAGKRDSIVVVAQLSPEFTARLIDRWRELENERSRPKSQNEIIAAMALANVDQERRINHVESKVDEVAETVEKIKRGSIPAGWAGFSVLKVKCGMSDAKCRTLVKSYDIPTDTITIMTPDGQPRPMKIVLEADFMATFRGMMTEAEQRNTKWFHPSMGLFQAIGWGSK
ncbi:DNA-binding protein [Enterobacterales bacterium CwR94]|nr:DNA-binding protein [Enterobacterales bacterium CwR94]